MLEAVHQPAGLLLLDYPPFITAFLQQSYRKTLKMAFYINLLLN